jgi:hypothetical protein
MEFNGCVTQRQSYKKFILKICWFGLSYYCWHDDHCFGFFDLLDGVLNRLRWFDDLDWSCNNLNRVLNHLGWFGVLDWSCDNLNQVLNRLMFFDVLVWSCDVLNHLRWFNDLDWHWTSDYVGVGKAVVNDRVWYRVKCECFVTC